MEIAAIHERVGRWAEVHGGALEGWALRLTRDRSLAEDVVQGTFVVALERPGAEVPAASERAWLFGIARRLAGRARRARRGLLAALARREPDAPAAGGPVARVLEDERRALVAAAVARCAPRQRDVLFHVFHENMTLDEAARAMGVSPGAARRHYHRAKEALRARLAAAGILAAVALATAALSLPGAPRERPAARPANVAEVWALPEVPPLLSGPPAAAPGGALEFTYLDRLTGGERSW